MVAHLGMGIIYDEYGSCYVWAIFIVKHNDLNVNRTILCVKHTRILINYLNLSKTNHTHFIYNAIINFNICKW